MFNLPNIITLCNLICGCLAIINATLYADFVSSFWLIVVATVFDFFDGFAARLLKVTSGIGKQLDSLADMVTFGVAPGIMVFVFMTLGSDNDYLRYIALLIPVFSALRLAKFNIDERQNDGFLGLPTPANALFFSSLLILDHSDILFFQAFKNLNLIAVIVIIFCFIMISELPLFALKFKSFAWKENKIKYIFLILAVLLSAIFFIQATPFIILLYIIMSLINNKISTK